MNKVIIIPDSFKGTLSSEQVCGIISSCIGKLFPDCRCIEIPFSDGGEGFLDCMKKICGGKIVGCTAKNPFFEDIDAEYLVLPDGETAVIESAVCAGIELVRERLDPSVTTTYGVGQLMKNAVERGCRRIILGLGGSCTNDCGAGAAAATGVCFIDKSGESFIPTGGSLERIAHIDADGCVLRNVEITTMCDVNAVLYGKNGAAYVFAPQKGADTAMAEWLDKGLRHISKIIRNDLGKDISAVNGSGAAGGFGGGVIAFWNGQLKSGIETLLGLADFKRLVKDADYVFSGEGKIDFQSADGKVLSGVCRLSSEAGVPVIAFTGGIDGDISALYKLGLTAAFSINTMPEELSVSSQKSADNLRITAENVLKLLKAAPRKNN